MLTCSAVEFNSGSVIHVEIVPNGVDGSSSSERCRIEAFNPATKPEPFFGATQPAEANELVA